MKPVLGILMRTDISGMTVGKFGAQTSHVTSAFTCHMETYETPLSALYRTWKIQTKQNFGTALTFAAKLDFIQDLAKPKDQMTASQAARMKNVVFGTITDPTYPEYIDYDLARGIQNGIIPPLELNIDHESQTALLLRPEVTGAYFFGDFDDPEVKILLAPLNLYPNRIVEE
jgi:hypothetical protein